MDFQRAHSRLIRVCVALLLLGLGGVASTAAARSLLLVVEAARDPAAGFVSQPLPSLQRQALAWPEGVITTPDSLAWLEHGPRDLAFRLESPPLVGAGATGLFTGEPGNYDIDTPLYLDDGRVVICLTGGRLEVTSTGLVYRRPPTGRSLHADLILLAGLALATALLLRLARRRSRSS